MQAIESLFRSRVSERQKEASEAGDGDASRPQDFIDAYLARIQAEEDPSSSFHRKLGVDILVNVGIELFFAGMETTAGALVWAFLYMAKYPEIQDRVQEEIDQVRLRLGNSVDE